MAVSKRKVAESVATKAGLIPAAGYIRMSSDKQEHSPERQRAEIEKLASREGFAIVEWYQDSGMTGTESAKRAGFQKMIADANAGRWKAVLLHEQSRLSRENIFTAVGHWGKFVQAGVEIVTTARGRLNLASDVGFLTAALDQMGAHKESQSISARTLGGKMLGLKRGQRQGGALFGYDREFKDEKGNVMRRAVGFEKFRKPMGWTSQLVPSEDQTAVATVRTIFREAAKGAVPGTIARMLNRQGVTTAMGSKWCDTSIMRVVQNPSYMGRITIGIKGIRRGKFHSVLDHGEPLSYDGAHKGLVSAELFEKAQAIRRKPQWGKGAKGPAGKYLLSGIVRCSTGAQLVGAGGSVRSFPMYIPTGAHFTKTEGEDHFTYRKDVIEFGVFRKVCEAIEQADMSAIAEQFDAQLKPDAVRSNTLREQLEAVRKKITRGTENLTLAEAVDVPAMSRLLAGWREDEKSILSKLRESEAPAILTAHPKAVATIRRLAAKAKSPKLLAGLPLEAREAIKTALREVVWQVTLTTEIRKFRRGQVRLWSGLIEFRDSLDLPSMRLTDADIPTRGTWRKAVEYAKRHDGPVHVRGVAEHFGFCRMTAYQMLASATAAGYLTQESRYSGWLPVPHQLTYAEAVEAMNGKSGRQRRHALATA